MVHKLPKIIAVIVTIASISVMIGWFFDVTVLKSIFPQLVTMKFTTAICFLLSGISLYCTAKINEDGQDMIKIILVFVDFLIILLMASLIISIFTNIRTGIEELFVAEAPGAINTTAPGRPALVTMIAFILAAITGLINLFGISKSVLAVTCIFGCVMIFVGVLVIIGYIFGISQFYGQFGGISSAVALHTAALFLLLGIGFVAVCIQDVKNFARH